MSIEPHATISVTMVRWIGLLSLLLFAACSRQPSPVVFVDPALAILVPPDTIALAGVRMGPLAKTPVFQRWVVQRRIRAFEEFRSRTGLDPAKDIWELLAATDGKEAVILIRGRFAEHGREPQLAIKGARRWAYKGYTLIGNDQSAVVFLNPTTAAAGSIPSVQRIVDRRDSGSGIPGTLDERVRRIPSTQQAWFVASVAGRLPLGELPTGGMWANMARLASSVQFASGGVDVREAFRSSISVESATEQAAEELRGALRALLGLGRLSTAEDRREMLSVFDGIQVSREASVVRFSTDIPFDLLEKSAAPFLTPRGK